MRIRKLLAVLLAALLILTIAGCSPVDEEALRQAARAEFDEFLDELFIEEVSSNTITLHYTLRYPENYGLENLPPKMFDLSMDDIESSYQEMRETLEYLKSVKTEYLTQEQKLIHKMLVKLIELNLSAEGLDYYGTYLDSISGLPSNMPINMAEYSFYTEKDVQNYLALLEQFPTLFEQALEYERTRIEMGLGLSDSSLNESIEQCNSFLKEIENNYLILTFNRRIDALGLDSAKTAEYKEKNKQAFLNYVVPAYKNMIKELETFKGKGKNDKGLAYFEKGKEYYQYLASYYTGTDYTVAQLASWVDSNLKSYSKQLYELVMSNYAAYEYFYDSNPYGYDVTGIEEMSREDATKIWRNISTEMLTELQEKMLSIVPALPENVYTIHFVEEALEESLSPAFYMIPPIDDYLDNTIYINLGSVNISSLYSTLAHEGYPGHLYQTVYFNNTEHHPIRSIITFDGYTEGWASYVEYLSFEMFDFEENYNYFFTKLEQLQNLIWLALYSRVDIGVNFEGWTKAEVAQCMNENYYNGDMAELLMNMVISSPATPLKYYIGYLEINSILTSTKARLGSKFDIVEFHKQLLDIGPMQFSIIREYINEYVEAKLNS
jgi:uncharacterized protein (DUF885 family)